MSDHMKPPTWDELQALVPWAHLSPGDDWAGVGVEEAEIVIYTGLTLNDADEVVWMKDMEDLVEEVTNDE